MTDATAQVSAVMIDCHDPEALFEFWSAVTGVEVAGPGAFGVVVCRRSAARDAADK